MDSSMAGNMLALLLLMTTFHTVTASNTTMQPATETTFTDALEAAAVDAIAQHPFMDAQDYPYMETGPYFSFVPHPGSPLDFMYSHFSYSGMNNREEFIIDEIKEETVTSDADVVSWHYQRFNSSDYIVGIEMNRMILWEMSILEDRPLHLHVEDAFYVYQAHGEIVEALLFTCIVKNYRMLHLAILKTSDGKAALEVYNVHHRELFSVMSQELFDKTPLKIAYVQSQYAGALTLLLPSFSSTELELRHTVKGYGYLSHVIEVGMPEPVDLTSFTIHGNGYLAVANTTTCTVLKLDEFVESHVHFYSVFVPELVDVDSFKVGLEDFLAVAGRREQHLFVWRGGGFARKQRFDIPHAFQWHSSAVSINRDDMLLWLLKFDQQHPISLFVWHGVQQQFVEIEDNVASYAANRISPLPGSVTSFTHNSKAHLLLVDLTTGMSRLLSVRSHFKPYLDPIYVQILKIGELMLELQDKLEKQEISIVRLANTLQHAVHPEGAVLNADDVLASITSAQNVLAHVDDVISFRWMGSDLIHDDLHPHSSRLLHNITAAMQKVEALEELLADAVPIDGAGVITGHKILHGTVGVPVIAADTLIIDEIDGVDVTRLTELFFRMDDPQDIEGSTIFQGAPTIRGSIRVGETVNGMVLSTDALLAHEEQTVLGATEFLAPVTFLQDLQISGTLNGISWPDDLITLLGQHIVTGPKHFLDPLLVTGDVKARFVDGIDVVLFHDDVLSESRDQVITGAKFFRGDVTMASNLSVMGNVNDERVRDLAHRLVRTDLPASIGTKVFVRDIAVLDDLTTNVGLNSLQIPSQLFLRHSAQVVYAPKFFQSGIMVYHVAIEGLVDDMKIPEDVVTLTANESIDHASFFEGIGVWRDVNVKGLVDGVKIPELVGRLVTWDHKRMDDVLTLGPVVVRNNLELHGSINGIGLRELIEDAVYKDDHNVVITGTKVFTKGAEVTSMALMGTVNRLILSEDFMLVDGFQVVTGHKTFDAPVTFGANLTTRVHMVDGTNFSSLGRSVVSLNSHGAIGGAHQFLDPVYVGDLTVSGTIDGIFTKDIVTRTSEQYIRNKKFVAGLDLSAVTVLDDMMVQGMIDGVDLGNLTRRVTLSTDQELRGDYFFGNGAAATVMVDGVVNGIDLSEYMVMSRTRDQTVSAAKVFQSRASILQAVTKEVNGVNLDEVNFQAVKLLESNVIEHRFVFEDPLMVESVTVEETINDVDLGYVAVDSVRRVGAFAVSGATSLHGFHANQDIEAGVVNGLNLSEDIFTRAAAQIVKGTYTFTNGVSVRGDIEVEQIVGIPMPFSQLVQSVAMVDRPTVIRGILEFAEDLHVLHDVVLSGTVDDIHLLQLADELVPRHGNQHISGPIVLAAPIVVRGDIAVNAVNGISLRQFLDDVIFTSGMQVVDAEKTFRSMAIAADVESEAVTVNGEINGVDLDALFANAVHTAEPAVIDGLKIFQQDVAAENINCGGINGLVLNPDFLLTTIPGELPQTIPGHKTFQHITMHNNLAVRHLVNGVVLPFAADNTLMTLGDQAITARKLLMDMMVIGEVHTGTVNGLDLADSVVTLQSDEAVGSLLVFNDGFFMSNDTNLLARGLVSGVNLTLLVTDAVYLETDQDVVAPFVLSKAMVEDDIEAQSTVNNVPLKGLDTDVEEFLETVTVAKEVMEAKIYDDELVSGYLTAVLHEALFELDMFVKFQHLKDVYGQHIRARPEDGIVDFILEPSEVQGTTALFRNKWNSTAFVSQIVAEVPYVYSSSFVLEGHQYHVHVPSVYHHTETTITRNDKKVASLGERILQVSILELVHGNRILLATVDNAGICEVYLGRSEKGFGIALQSVATLDTGKETTRIKLLEMRGEIYLAVARNFPPPYQQGYSLLFRWTRQAGFQLAQEIPAIASQDLVHFRHGHRNYLVFSDAVPVHVNLEPNAVLVYRSSDQRALPLKLFQKVYFDDCTHLEVFEFGSLPDLYMVASNSSHVEVFHFTGENGFVLQHKMFATDVLVTKPFMIDNSLYLAVGQGVEADFSIIYKAIMKGSTLKQWHLHHWS